MNIHSEGFAELAKGYAAYPKEALMKVGDYSKSLQIGLPKERELYENRIILTPDGVNVLVNNGHEVMVETGAGKPSKFTDREFSEAGAKIVYSSKEVFECDIVLKLMPPSQEEISMMKPGKSVISTIQSAKLTKSYLEALNKKRITGIAFEFLEDKVGGRPIIRAMSEIAGSTVMLIAAEYLSSTNNGKGIILGGITGVPPTKVVILGAGTVSEYAARAAFGLGAEVKIFGDHLYKLRRLKQSLGTHIYTSTINLVTLSDALKEADVAIGAMRAEQDISACIVTEDMVSQMKPNSVIIDVSIDQGGCFETSEITTHQKPVFTKYDIIHYCIPNIASGVARTASTALSNIFTPNLVKIGDCGGIDGMILANEGFLKGVYTYNGSVSNAAIAKRFNMNHKDLRLLFAARL